MKNERRIEYMPLSKLAKSKAKRNPKEHDVGAISQSIDRHGYVEPIIMDDRTARLVAGHGRIETLQALLKEGKSPPDGVKQAPKSQDWLVPVIRGWASKNDAQAEAYLLASNRLVELGGWNEDELGEMLQGLAKKGELEGSGYDGDDLDQMFHATDGEDDVPETPRKPWVKPGQLFQLGKHRILCGDSTKKKDVERVLDGAKPFLMVTDPPYGVNYDASWRDGMVERLGKTVSAGKVVADDRVDWSRAYGLFSGDVAYVWHASLFGGQVAENLATCGLSTKCQIIWVKPHFVIGRGHYHPQHEACWYAVRGGATNAWHGDKAQSTVWDVAQVSGFNKTNDVADENTGAHGTPKPVELYRRAIKNSSQMGMGVYEPFSGSGTCIVACEELSRHCYAIEISPTYVQTAIERWEKFTGEKHVKL